MSDGQRADVALILRGELARRRISRQRMADDAGLSLSTLEKALAGSRSFTLATLLRLEASLGLTLRPTASPRPATGLAPESLGAYARAAVAWLEGDHLTLRPSFDEPGAVYAYRTRISWDNAASALTFSEQARLDAAFSQVGLVSLSNQSGHIYLVTNSGGQYRLAILSRPLITGEMYGVLATLRAGRGAQLTPAVAPLALLPLAGDTDRPTGLIRPGDAPYAEYRDCLDKITAQGFANFLG